MRKPIVMYLTSSAVKDFLQKRKIKIDNDNNDGIFIATSKDEVNYIIKGYITGGPNCILKLNLDPNRHLRDTLNIIRLYKKEHNIKSLIFIETETVDEIQLRNILLLTDVAGVIIDVSDTKTITSIKLVNDLIKNRKNNYGCGSC